jgi:hypothetical protein
LTYSPHPYSDTGVNKREKKSHTKARKHKTGIAATDFAKAMSVKKERRERKKNREMDPASPKRYGGQAANKR